MLIDLWFPRDCYYILHNTFIDYRFVNSYEEEYIHSIINQPQNQDYHI